MKDLIMYIKKNKNKNIKNLMKQNYIKKIN